MEQELGWEFDPYTVPGHLCDNEQVTQPFWTLISAYLK